MPPANIIVFGRSIGSGPATWLAAKKSPGCLLLLSAFSTLQSVVRDFVGAAMSKVIRERFRNVMNMKKVKCPTLIVHGKDDGLISYQHSQLLSGITPSSPIPLLIH